MNTAKVGTREYPVVAYVEDEKMGSVPMPDAPMMSDYSWDLLALRSRVADPEFYRTVAGENVEAVIAKLRQKLAQYSTEARCG